MLDCSAQLTDPRALFKYYTTVLDRVTPSGGFVDGGTSVTLYGTGFHDFNGDVALARVGFGGNESLRQPVNALQPTTLEVTAPAVGGNESIEVMLALSLNGVDFDEGMTPVTYKYYYHSSRLLVPSGGPAVGGTAVTVHGEGFESFDGLATSARCRFGEQVVPVTSLDDAAVACVAPPAIALSDVGDTTTGWPEAGATYSWIDAAGGDTAGAGAVEQLLQVAANEVDFRGDRGFFYYHQVMEKVESEASKESQRAGPPTGGYRVTIVGAGFLGFDANASTILVAFGAAGATASNANELAAEANASAGNMTVTAIEVTDTTVVVIAPEASLDEGEVWTERKSPCWNPPCRRVVLTMALNGVDFVGGATEDASEFFFFIDPPRYPFPGALLWTEFWMYVGGLLGLQLLNILITWYFRFQLYDRWLKLKYFVKNKTVYKKNTRVDY